MQQPGALLSPNSKNKKNSPLFQETEFFYIPGNGNPLKTFYISGSNFPSSEKNVLYFGKWNFLAPKINKLFLYFY